MGGKKQLTTEKFIERSNIKHNFKYDYSKSFYIKSKEKVCIICPIHGEFWQQAGKYMNGDGCPKCAINAQHTTESFIRKAKQIHGDKYDYSKVEYVNNHTKICIIDKECGEFWQLPQNHLKGCGCHINHGKRVWNTRGRITTEEFINRARKVHGDKYNYSLVEYKGANVKVEIICKKCGKHFKQTPNNHINQQNGCPFCNESKLEKEVEMFLNKKHIIFEKQKRFNWLGRQSLDFYLPKYNIGIECQGEQHYKPVDFGGKGIKWATEQFKYTIKKDNIKKRKCENNGVKLLYYSNFNKKIVL